MVKSIFLNTSSYYKKFNYLNIALFYFSIWLIMYIGFWLNTKNLEIEALRDIINFNFNLTTISFYLLFSPFIFYLYFAFIFHIIYYIIYNFSTLSINADRFDLFNPIYDQIKQFVSSLNLNYVEYLLYLNSKVINSLISFNFEIIENYKTYPIFIMFGLFFLFTIFISLIMGSYLGMYGVFILNLVALIGFWFSMIPYINLIFSENTTYFITLGKWMYLNSNYKITFDFFIDNISLSFSFLTLTIALCVYPYTFSYFRYEPLIDRLILFLSGFIISMIFLVSSGNFIMLFLGWEMIGLTSFFLINFWSSRVGTLKAAFKAYSFNKTSDMFLFLAIIIIFNVTFNLDIIVFLNQIHLYEHYTIKFLNFNINFIELVSVSFLICAFIKSAQLGAHIWLPDSMEAPVPASALIHSATLVSAGIFLLLRFNNLFELSSISYYIIATVGSITAFYGGLVSMYQSDVKRILAYSTISHCGFLMVVYTTGVIEYVLLYLYIHGFFKAAVFLCVGNVIRYTRNVQDYKRMGMLYKYLPFDCFASFICLVNLSGLPLSFGFYIKHLLFVGLVNNFYFYLLVLTFSILGALTGLFYSYRLFFNVFFDFKKSKKTLYYQSSRLILNSKHYITSATASLFSIIILIILSYLISSYFLILYLNIGNDVGEFTKNYLNIAQYQINYGSLSFYLNTSIINWFVIILIFLIIFTNWRGNRFFHNYLNMSQFVIFFFLFFFFFKLF